MVARTDDLNFARDGAAHLPGVVAGETLCAIERLVADLPRDRAGLRLNGVPGVRALLASGPVHAAASARIGPDAAPVRALLFDKTPDANWSLGWHQDRVIVVRKRIDVPGYNAWTNKGGLLHVSPPWRVMAGLVTLRVHLDPVGEGDAPLLIAPGSHRLGRVAEPAVPDVVRHHGVATCLADRGDIWVYATPILHASAAKITAGRRRVLQVDYAVGALDGGLEWQGV